MIRILLFALLLPVFCNAQTIENLDIKNGFLQFRLGDSIGSYKSIISPLKKGSNYYQVKLKEVKLKRNIEKLTLYFENNILSSIEVTIHDDSNVSVMMDALKRAYGNGIDIANNSEARPGFQSSYIIWNGKRVVATLKIDTLTLTVNNMTRSSTFGTLIFKKTSDLKIDGELGPDFPL